MISSRYSSLTSAVTTLRERLSHPCWMWLWWGNNCRQTPSAWELLAWVPQYRNVSDSRHLTQSYKGKFARSSFSVRRFHGASFFEKPSGWLPLRWCWLYRPDVTNLTTEANGSDLHPTHETLTETLLFDWAWVKTTDTSLIIGIWCNITNYRSVENNESMEHGFKKFIPGLECNYKLYIIKWSHYCGHLQMILELSIPFTNIYCIYINLTVNSSQQ